MTEVVVKITEASIDAQKNGGKGNNLVYLSKLSGVQVPEGFIVTTSAYKTMLESSGLAVEVRQLEKGFTEWINAKLRGQSKDHLETYCRKVLAISDNIRYNIEHFDYISYNTREDCCPLSRVM